MDNSEARVDFLNFIFFLGIIDKASNYVAFRTKIFFYIQGKPQTDVNTFVIKKDIKI